MLNLLQKDRSKENGILKFHHETEDELAEYVLRNSTKGNIKSVIKTVDEFCWNKHWMMHIGDKKGKILDEMLLEFEPKIILELGTYCGYSSIRMCGVLPNCHVYTIDPFPTNCSKILIEQSNVNDRITCLGGTGKDVIPTLSNLKNQIDMVFIDHDKKQYLSDLLLIESNDLLHKGSVVVADNVLVFNINDYLHHVRESGLYKSKNYESVLEYDDTGKIDGIEVSIKI